MLELEQKNNTNKNVCSQKKSDNIEDCIPNLEVPHIIDEITQNYSKLLKITPNYSKLLTNNSETSCADTNNNNICKNYTDGKKYFCNICNRGFIRKYNFLRHLNTSKCSDNNINHKKSHFISEQGIINIPNKESKCASEPQMNHKEPQMNHKESQRITNESQMNHKESQINESKNINDKRKYECKNCGKLFNTNSNMNRHMKKYCKYNYENDLDIAMKKIAQYENNLQLVTNNTNNTINLTNNTTNNLTNNTTNNLTNNTTNNLINNMTNNLINNIETVNMNNINNLNMYFSNVIPIETFLYNIEHEYKITQEEAETLLYSSENMGIGDLADCFEKIITKNCKEQTKNMFDSNGMKMLPTIPILCTDGSMRSHKERLMQSWDTIYNDKNFEKMWNIINDRVYELTNKYIFISNKDKKKLYSKVKQKVSTEELRNQVIETCVQN